jgi:hypothetical protein
MQSSSNPKKKPISITRQGINDLVEQRSPSVERQEIKPSLNLIRTRIRALCERRKKNLTSENNKVDSLSRLLIRQSVQPDSLPKINLSSRDSPCEDKKDSNYVSDIKEQKKSKRYRKIVRANTYIESPKDENDELCLKNRASEDDDRISAYNGVYKEQSGSEMKQKKCY